MDWNNTLYLSIFGVVLTIAILVFVTWLGMRYRREIPKRPIVDSLEALKLRQDEEEASLAELRDELFQARSDIHEGQAARQFLESARPEMESLRQQLSECEIASKSARAEADAAEEDLKELERAVEAATQAKGELAEAIAPLKVDLAESKARLERAKEDLADYEKKREELASLEAKLPSIREETARLEESRAVARKERDQINYELKDLRKEHSKLEGAVEGLKEQQEQLLDAITDLRKTHSAAGGISDDHDPCRDLWQPCFEGKKESDKQSEESRCLDDMASQLKAAEVHFSKRTLYAFHTALKVQGISPLTVLAGISGTGKSLLPRLYSKCMGVHFLNLPVQPGWNSPQDLFGFYNYIEQKFKATPLARALVQFDRFGRGEWPLPKSNEDFGDQMLLVLLDEMNLARVEYYFSELLSRLELRRTIDPNDRDERQKVEIPLEIGHAVRGKGEKLRDFGVSLYPGDNVLFTGTMNEDESTMSLSDKVLDRATVLRFGKPRKLLGKQPDMSKIRATAPMSNEVWRSWVGSRHTVISEVQEHIEKLSEVMDLAGVPFGHRVAQGMTDYVAHYPAGGREAQHHALIDQVEQKLLPKLRGRDLEEVGPALQKLQQLASLLSDAQLENAIAKGQHQGTFHWSGLDRLEE